MKNSAPLSARGALFVALAAGSLYGTACRHHGDLRKQYQEMRPNMMKGDWATAVAQLQKAAPKELLAPGAEGGAGDAVYSESDRVMFWLNMGTALHYAGDHGQALQYFVKADDEMKNLWTTSISEEASKLAVSETIQDYKGEDFERMLVFLFTALGHVEAGNIQSALVEARAADEFLKWLQTKFEQEKETSIYKQDAFMLWLVGLFYEVEKNYSQAFQAYRASLEAYQKEYAGNFGTPVPEYVKEDAVRSAVLGGVADEAEKLKQETGAKGETLDKLNQGMSEIVLIHGNGEAPYREELFIDGTMPDGYVMRIALPKFVDVPHQTAGAEVAAGGNTAKTMTAEPITTIALKSFEHRLPGIQARAIARAVIKYAATKGAEAAAGGANSTAGALVGLAGNVASAASEAADLRAWTTLPGSIEVARLWVTPGQHEVDISFFSASGSPAGAPRKLSVDLKPGERKIISVRTFE